MNLDSIDLNMVGNIIGSMSPDDIESLKGVAQAMFSSSENKKEPPKHEPPKAQSSSGFDFSAVSKIASVMNLLSSEQKDPRCDLLKALKPLLSDDKKGRVDEALRMIQLFAIIPKIKELG